MDYNITMKHDLLNYDASEALPTRSLLLPLLHLPPALPALTLPTIHSPFPFHPFRWCLTGSVLLGGRVACGLLVPQEAR